MLSSNKKLKKTQAFLETALGQQATLTFESFALEGLCHNTGRLALDLLGLPESFAQLLYIVTIDYVCVPSTKAKHNVLQKILTTKKGGGGCNSAKERAC